MSDLISREAAIEAIQTAYCTPCKERGDDYNEVRCRACAFDDAMNVIDAIDDAIDANSPQWAILRTKIGFLPSAEADWIPCSERLPKTGDSVLVTYSDREVGIIWSARPKAWVTYIESNNLIYPIAWMPLPPSYRGK